MLRSWCNQNGYSHGRKISHVLMDGGVLSIPKEATHDFYEVYIKCIHENEKVFVVEQKTDIYNFFMDIDYKDENPLTVREVENISQTICSRLETVMNRKTKCMISVAHPKRKGNLIKTGIHLNWDNIPVNKTMALRLMNHAIEAMNSVYSSKNWSEYIDCAVYGEPDTQSKGSGFRLPWSHKKGKHEACGGHGCMVCDNTGKLTEGEYLPVFMYEDKVLKGIDQEPTIDKLAIATIRTTSSESIEVQDVQFRPARRVKREGDFTSSQIKEVLDNEDAMVHLETFIRKYVDGQHNARVLKIFKHKKNFLVKTDSRYCENIRRSHNSNHIWFLINSKTKTICQKCFCRCDTLKGRRYGLCKNFSGREHLLTMNSTLSGLLFDS